MNDSKQLAFTLIELLVVLVIIGIIASIALPSYRQQVMKTKRSNAIVALSEIAQLQERFFNEKSSYTSTIYSTGSAANVCRGIVYPNPDDYTLAITTTVAPVITYNAGTGNCIATTVANNFTVTATATGPQLDDTICKTLSINSLGVKSSTNSAASASNCW